MSRGKSQGNGLEDTPEALKKSSKKFSKPLDKPHRMWYNNSVLKRGTQQQEKENSKKPERENPMKNEVRVAATESVMNLLSLLPNLTPVRVAKKDGYAFDTGVKDENGKPVYAFIEATIKNTEDTKTSKAFDLDEAVAARTGHDNAPKKETKSKEADPEVEAKRAKREEQKQALHNWLTDNLTDQQMTTTDIQAACSDVANVTIMQVGSWLTAIAKEDSSIKRDVVKGKPYYSKA